MDDITKRLKVLSKLDSCPYLEKRKEQRRAYTERFRTQEQWDEIWEQFRKETAQAKYKKQFYSRTREI